MKKISIEICHGKTCSKYYPSLLKKKVERLEEENVELTDCACLGQCEKAPNVIFNGEVLNTITPQSVVEKIKNNII